MTYKERYVSIYDKWQFYEYILDYSLDGPPGKERPWKLQRITNEGCSIDKIYEEIRWFETERERKQDLNKRTYNLEANGYEKVSVFQEQIQLELFKEE